MKRLKKAALLLVTRMSYHIKLLQLFRGGIMTVRSPEVSKGANGADTIVNAILPAFDIHVMKECFEIKAHSHNLYSIPYQEEGVPYPETIDAQFDLHDDFRKPGIAAFHVVGICPGWSTMAAKYLIDQFDEVDKVQLRSTDVSESDELFTPVIPSILFYHCLGTKPTSFDSGRLTPADLIDDLEHFEFRELIGKRWVYPDSRGTDYAFIPRFV